MNPRCYQIALGACVWLVVATPAHGLPAWQRLYADLQALPPAYAQFFTRVAIVETGWSLQHGVGQWNNFFGMRARPGYAATAHGYAVYLNQRAAVLDFLFWVSQNPPLPAESPEAYLRRRGWNPFEGYFDYLSKVDPFKAAGGARPATAQAQPHGLQTQFSMDGFVSILPAWWWAGIQPQAFGVAQAVLRAATPVAHPQPKGTQPAGGLLLWLLLGSATSQRLAAKALPAIKWRWPRMA